MKQFDNKYTQQKVYFGQGTCHIIGEKIAESGFKRPLIVSSDGFEKNHAQNLYQHLGLKDSRLYTNAQMHTPVAITQHTLKYLQQHNNDCLIAVGGGTSIGLTKALALRTGLKQFVVPTTYAGSEATNILGQTENGVKTTLRDNVVLPDSIFYDSDFVSSLPVHITVFSALNAIAHAVEALYANNTTIEITKLAMFGIKWFAKRLNAVINHPQNVQYRQDTQKGAWACGTVLSLANMSLHHKLCHVLGGSFHLPHAETHSVILPHATAYNEMAVAEQLKPVAECLGGDTACGALWDFAKNANAPMSLQQLGLQKQDIIKAVEIATEKPYWNPRALDFDGILELLERAFSGTRPVIK